MEWKSRQLSFLYYVDILIAHTDLLIGKSCLPTPGFQDFSSSYVWSTECDWRRLLGAYVPGWWDWIHIWARLRLGVLFMCFFWARNNPFWERRIFRLRFFAEGVDPFEGFLVGDLLRGHKSRFRVGGPECYVKCGNNRGSCGPCRGFWHRL